MPTHNIIDNLKQRPVECILAAEGGTGIPACASAASQTRMSVAQWERVYRLYLPAPTRLLRCSQRGQGLRQAGGLTPEEIKIVEGAGT